MKDPGDTTRDSASPGAHALVQDHRERWRRGERIPVESYLQRSQLSRVGTTALLDLVYSEVILREEDGESPRLDEYLERFPVHAEALRAQFEIHQALRTSGSFNIALTETSLDHDPGISSPDEVTGVASVGTKEEVTPRSRPDLGSPARAPASVAADPNWPRVEGFDILGVLGSGGMGTVFRAYDRRCRRHVALKTMNRAGAVALLRFKHEFRTLLDVVHPNLVTLYELIGDGQHWVLTMELLDGVDFLRYVRSEVREPMPPGTEHSPTIEIADTDLETSAPAPDEGAVTTDPASREISPSRRARPSEVPPPVGRTGRLRAALRQLAEGICALHVAGKLHRDIKPSNVIVTHDGRVVLLDFGLAAEQDEGGEHHSTEDHLVGTAAYMAPEQAAGLPVSAAGDWYSVGVMLFEALTGRLPFRGSVLEILMEKQRREPPAPAELAPDVPEDLNALCVELLRRRPEDRPPVSEILRRLAGGDAPADPDSAAALAVQAVAEPRRGKAIRLVGRDHHQAVLREAFADLRLGRPVVVYLHGSSGAGKSALLRSFLDDVAERDDAVVLAGRCYERESVPYKALDSLIDALGRHLGRLDGWEAAAVLPRDVGSLARVFPILRRVPSIAETPVRGVETPDPQELRRRAFAALRELLARLGDRKPLVLAIDDLQWGDADSAALLIDLLRPPDAPVFLLVAAFRAEDRASGPLLRALLGSSDQARDARLSGVDCRELEVRPLEPAEARVLARDLLGESGPPGTSARDDVLEAIVRESGGNPFFVWELVRHVRAGVTHTGLELALDEETASGSRPAEQSGATRLALDEVLWSRIRRLPDEPRRVLELIAVAGRPLRLIELGRCVEMSRDEHASLALLRAERLVRGTGRAETDEVEAYHDRVRETILARIDRETTRDHHHRLAIVLEESGQADPEVLGVHFLGAGLPERAADHYARAAEQAAGALAFERAAALYELALELRPGQAGRDWLLHAGMGDALASAGRGADAAASYLLAVPGAPPAEALELQRRAAMQFLISGHIDEGLGTLQAVLRAIGLTLPATPQRALLSLLWWRGRLRLRGLGFRERVPGEIAPADLNRVDVCWSAGVGLSVVDTIRGADFQARGLLLALEAGEPSRIARALAMEAAHAASTGGSNRRTTERLLTIAEALTRRVEHPYALGMVTLARGVAAYLEGRWAEAQVRCDQAEAIFRDRCTGVAWEINTAGAFSLWGLSHQGEVAELSRRWPVLLAQAIERGNLYAAMNLSSYLMSIVKLAADDPDAARAGLRETAARWSTRGYHVQHNDALWAAVQIELYRGDGPAAWELLRASWPALRRSLLLRVQFIRTSMLFLRARAAIAAAVALKGPRPSEARALLALADRDARRLAREGMPCPEAYAWMIRGALAALRGDPERGASQLAEAILRFDAVDMRLCSAAVRRRLGELIGGDAGRAAVVSSEDWMRGQEIRDPARMAGMILANLIEDVTRPGEARSGDL